MNYKHGYSNINSRLYRIWSNMKTRCYNSKATRYCSWGGRGITICDEWRNDFKAFYNWAIQNGYQDNLTIDRINNDGNYEPSNCRWVTAKEQTQNIKTNHFLTFNGKTQTLCDWARELGINHQTLTMRLKYGWTIDKTLSTSIQKGGQHARG